MLEPWGGQKTGDVARHSGPPRKTGGDLTYRSGPAVVTVWDHMGSVVTSDGIRRLGG
jgi:hypothetical protein